MMVHPTRRGTCVWPACLVWLACAGLLALAAHGQQAAPTAPAAEREAPPVIKYRRYLIPDEAKTELTSGYRPLRHDKFAELLGDVRRKANSEQSQVYLVGARYFAVLDGPLLRDGFALWDFHNPASIPVPARVTPLQLSVSSAVWELPDRAPASMGADGSGANWVLVPQSGRLILSWSLRGTAQLEGRADFLLRLPSSPTNQLVVAVPRGTSRRRNRGSSRPGREIPSNGPIGPKLRAWWRRRRTARTRSG